VREVRVEHPVAPLLAGRGRKRREQPARVRERHPERRQPEVVLLLRPVGVEIHGADAGHVRPLLEQRMELRERPGLEDDVGVEEEHERRGRAAIRLVHARGVADVLLVLDQLDVRARAQCLRGPVA
jgi:hypothetical protein